MLTVLFPAPSGTRSYPRPNSSSTYSAKHHLQPTCQYGNTTTVSPTTTPHRSTPLDANSPSTTNRAHDRFIIGLALNHYCYHKVVDTTTKTVHISDTVNFYHSYLTQPTVIPEDRIVHVLHFLSCTIKNIPATMHTKLLEALTCIRNIFLPIPPQTIPPYSMPQQTTQTYPWENPLAAPRLIAQRPPATATPPSPVHTPSQPPRVHTPTAPPALPLWISIGNRSTP